jgi:hypothetical protein
MSFAAPIGLLFLGLFVPVILFYFLKQRRRQVEVSTLMFWDRILRDEQSVTSLSRLKKILSLLLQLLFIALLAFAVARPLLSGKLTGARRIVLLLDASASMLVKEGNKTRFDLARDKAFGVVRGMSIGDSLMLVSVAREPDILLPFTDSKKAAEEVIEQLSPLHSETNFKEALRLVENLPADARPTDVYLITDGAFEPVEISAPTNTHFAYLRVGEQTENVGITAFQVRPLPQSARDFQIHVEISNQTKADQKVPLELRMGGHLLDAYEFTIAAGQTTTRTLRQFSAEGGPIEAIIDFKDAFPLDNKAYAILPRPQAVKVRLVTPGNPFLERALATDDNVELQTIDPNKYTQTNDAAVTVFAGWTPAKTPAGFSIFIGSWPEELGLVRRGDLEKPLFTDWDREHPINRHLSLQNVAIEKAMAVTPGSGFQKLASSFGDPLVLLRQTETQSVLVFTFDTASSDLPLRVAFPIMIGNAVRYFGQTDTGDRWMNPSLGTLLTAADLARYKIAGVESTNSLRSIIGPDEKKSAVEANAVTAVSQAGFYWAESATGEKTPLFAATLSSRFESRIAPAGSMPLRGKKPLSELKNAGRIGFEPWILLALLGAVLSTVEWGLFHRRVIE